MMLRPASVHFDEGPNFPCMLPPQTWNGWAMPFFTEKQAKVVNKALGGTYDPEQDAFVFPCSWSNDPEEEPDVYAAEIIDGVKYYPIGAGCCTWNYPYEDDEGNNIDPWADSPIPKLWAMLAGYAHNFLKRGMDPDNLPIVNVALWADKQEDEAKLRQIVRDCLFVATTLNITIKDNLRAHSEAIARGENPFANYLHPETPWEWPPDPHQGA